MQIPAASTRTFDVFGQPNYCGDYSGGTQPVERAKQGSLL